MSLYTAACPAGTRYTSSGDTGFCAVVGETKPLECPAGTTAPNADPYSTCSGGVPKGCPTGYKAGFGENYRQVCMKSQDVPPCPAGTTREMLMTKTEGWPPKAFCVKTGAPSYSRMNIQTPGGWPCNGSDPFSTPPGSLDGPQVPVKCYGTEGATAAAPAAAAAPVTPPFASLDTNYHQQVAAYQAAVEESIRANDPSRLPELRTMSEGIQTTLNRMIENVTYLKKDTPGLRGERDALLETLRRIQRDYGAMLANTDDLETLRRIREQEGGEAKRLLMMYMMAFLFVSCMLLIYLVYSGRSTPTSPTTAAMPTMSAALT